MSELDHQLTRIESEWFLYLEREVAFLLDEATTLSLEGWLAENPERTEEDWKALAAYREGQQRIASVIRPTLEALSWTYVPHELANAAGEWLSIWDCWHTGATATLPRPVMMLDYTVDDEPLRIEQEGLVYYLYGALITAAPEGGIIVHSFGGPAEWHGLFHFAPVALVPDAVAAKLKSGELPWGYPEAIIRTPGSPVIPAPQRASPKTLARWAGGQAVQIAVGVLKYARFDEPDGTEFQ
jgi:hypothetical protein